MATGRGRTRTRDEAEDDAPRGRTRGRGGAPDKERRPAGMRGRAGVEVAKQEAEKAKARRSLNKFGPFRFWLEPGETDVEVIITDESVDDVFWMHEHALWNGKGNDFVPCTKDQPNAEPCVLCAEAEATQREKNSVFKFPYYAMFLSVIDTRSYKNKDGEVVDFSKRLLVVKQSQYHRFWQILEAAQKAHGTIRGVSILLSRGDDKSARHGEPQMLDNGMLYDMIPEKELLRDFGTPAVKPGKDGKGGRDKNWELTPYDYDAEFSLPEQKELAAAYDLDAPEGSKAAMEAEWEGKRRRRGAAADDAQDDPPPRRRRGAQQEEPDEDPDGDPDDDNGDPDDNGDEPDDNDPPPRSRRTRGRAEPEDEPPARGRGRGRAQQEEEPPARGRNRNRRQQEEEPAPRSRTRSRAQRDLDEDEIPF